MTHRLGRAPAVALSAEAATRRRESVRHTNRLQELMLRMMTVFSPELTLDDVIERMVKVTTHIFNVSRVGLFLVDLRFMDEVKDVEKDPMNLEKCVYSGKPGGMVIFAAVERGVFEAALLARGAWTLRGIRKYEWDRCCNFAGSS